MNNKVDLTQLTLAELSVISALLKKTITLFLHKLRNTDFIVFNSIIYIYKYIYIFFIIAFATPKKISFYKLRSETVCFSCGEEKPEKHMRRLNNEARDSGYLSLIKETFLIELSPETMHRTCETCIRKMEKVCCYLSLCLAWLDGILKSIACYF